MPRYYTKAGRLTRYALECGYVEQAEHNSIQTTLWRSHGAYHVRQHEYGGRGRITWESFRSLAAARRRYDDLVRKSRRAPRNLEEG